MGNACGYTAQYRLQLNATLSVMTGTVHSVDFFFKKKGGFIPSFSLAFVVRVWTCSLETRPDLSVHLFLTAAGETGFDGPGVASYEACFVWSRAVPQICSAVYPFILCIRSWQPVLWSGDDLNRTGVLK